jgi:hypothetical protein
MSVDVPAQLMGSRFAEGSLGWLCCSRLSSLLGSSNPDVVFGSALATIDNLYKQCSMTVNARLLHYRTDHMAWKIYADTGRLIAVDNGPSVIHEDRSSSLDCGGNLA